MKRFSVAKITIAAALLCAAIFLFARFSKKRSGENERLPETVSFNFHIRPILSDRCFKCHGPDERKREAGLRFDTQEGAFAALNPSSEEEGSRDTVAEHSTSPLPFGGGAGGGVDTKESKPHYAIVPYHPEQSTLVQRIFSMNPDSIMPSPDSHLSLSDFEKKLLKKWIEQGAKWEQHWAFTPPQKP
ncbi:MAG: hypothetical protein KA165_13715, partial [Saprospiraceae bacterium]|nr:hypothetical protein [Saprospiraceae bacterium]